MVYLLDFQLVLQHFLYFPLSLLLHHLLHLLFLVYFLHLKFVFQHFHSPPPQLFHLVMVSPFVLLLQSVLSLGRLFLFQLLA